MELRLAQGLGLVLDPPSHEKGGPSLRNLFELTKGKSAIESMEDLRQLVDDLIERGCLRLVQVQRDLITGRT